MSEQAIARSVDCECLIFDVTSNSLRSSSIHTIALILANSLPSARATHVVGSELASMSTIARTKVVSEIGHSQSTERAIADSFTVTRDHARDRLGYRLQHFPCSAQSLAVIKFEVPLAPTDPSKLLIFRLLIGGVGEITSVRGTGKPPIE